MNRDLLAIVTLVCTTLLPAQSLTTPSEVGPAEVGPAEVGPAEVGMEAGVLEAGADIYRRLVERDELRGVVLLVARKGKTVLHTAYGWCDEDKKVPMRKDTLFRLASNTKPIVATAVLMLVDEKKIDLEAPVGRYLPAFDNEKNRGLTIHRLLSHTSGLRIRGLFLSPLMKASEKHPRAPTLRLEVDRFASIGPKEKPGATYSYSNPGFNILGALVEAVSGELLADFISKRIYAPLAMSESCHHETVADNERMSSVFRRTGTGWRVSWKPGGPPTVPFVRASGGGIGSATDYATFLQMWLDGGLARSGGVGTTGGARGRTRVLRGETVKLAAQPHSAPCYTNAQRASRTAFYGYGWSVSKTGVFSHGGSDGTFAWVDPKNEVVGLVFTQSPGGKNPRGQFINIVAASITR